MESDLDALRREALAFKRSAFAANSQRTYKSQLRCYLQFCLDFDQKKVPASQETLSCYLAYLAR